MASRGFPKQKRKAKYDYGKFLPDCGGDVRHYDDMLGLVGQHAKTCKQKLEIPALLLGLHNRHSPVLAAARIHRRLVRRGRQKLCRRPFAGGLPVAAFGVNRGRGVQPFEYFARYCNRHRGACRGVPRGNRACARLGRDNNLRGASRRRPHNARRGSCVHLRGDCPRRSRIPQARRGRFYRKGISCRRWRAC